MQESVNYLYSPITSKGLGLKYSSLEKIGTLTNQNGFGAANLKCWPNVSTGNLVFQDQVLPIKEENFDLNLRFTYNSDIKDTATAWQFSIKRLHPNVNNQVVLQEEDGHLTTFAKDPNNPTILYYALESAGSTKFTRFDARPQYNCWILHDPETGEVEYYNPQGLLIKKTDKSGRVTTYEYDVNQQLIAINSPTNNRYELRRQNNTIDIYDANHNVLLHTYQNDKLGRLVLSQTADGYKTQYDYINDTSQLYNVLQSDNTTCRFTYNTTNNSVNSIQMGNSSSSARIAHVIYSANQAVIKDSFNIQTTISFDDNNDTTQIKRQTGYDQVFKTQDITTFTYTDTHQLEDTVRPDDGIEHKEYDPLHNNLISRHVQPNSQTTEFVYVNDSETTKLICKIDYLSPQIPVVTRYVYDSVDDGINVNIFLRYKISAEGRVTEYRPDTMGNIASKREYITNFFDVSHYQQDTAPDISTMNLWMSKQDPQQISLTTYLYDEHGQINTILGFSNIDQQGNGIQDEYTSVEYIFSDLYGNITQHEVKQTQNNTSITNQRFDDTQRLIKKIDALNNTTNFEFRDAQSEVKITHPNNKVDLHKRTDSNLNYATQSTASDINGVIQIRNTTVERDAGGRIVVTNLPDGNQLYSFYDRQNRLGFTVTSLGIVAEYRYDAINNFNTQIDYKNPIDINQLIIVPGTLPTASTLIALIKQVADPNRDRYKYSFLDNSKRKIFDVDADQFPVQYLYDNLNRECGVIEYATKLTNDELNQLKLGKSLQLSPDFSKDCCKRKFFDKDGKVIGVQVTCPVF